MPGFGLAARGFKGNFGDALAGRTGPGILSRIKSMNNGGYFNPNAFIYRPTPKHDPVSGWGSKNPIPDAVEGWHAYLVINTSEEVPTEALRKMLDDGIITRAQYKKFTKNKQRDQI